MQVSGKNKQTSEETHGLTEQWVQNFNYPVPSKCVRGTLEEQHLLKGTRPKQPIAFTCQKKEGNFMP